MAGNSLSKECLERLTKSGVTTVALAADVRFDALGAEMRLPDARVVLARDWPGLAFGARSAGAADFLPGAALDELAAVTSALTN